MKKLRTIEEHNAAKIEAWEEAHRDRVRPGLPVPTAGRSSWSRGMESGLRPTLRRSLSDAKRKRAGGRGR